MSRATCREPSGRWGVRGVNWAEVPDGLYGALYKLLRYEDRCEDPQLIESMMDADDFTRWALADRAHNVWQCGHCGRLHRFEADGLDENGFACCPYCGKFIGHAEEDGAETLIPLCAQLIYDCCDDLHDPALHAAIGVTDPYDTVPRLLDVAEIDRLGGALMQWIGLVGTPVKASDGTQCTVAEETAKNS